MSMPVIVPGTGSLTQAITDLVESVALEETALSHILNAEGEKIQAIVQKATTSADMIAVNNSAQSMVNAITRLEVILQGKLEMFSDCLCTG